MNDQLELFYEGIIYDGKRRTFYHHYTQEWSGVVPDAAMYSSFNEERIHTLSSMTLEDLRKTGGLVHCLFNHETNKNTSMENKNGN